MELKKVVRLSVIVCLEGVPKVPVAKAFVDEFDVVESDGVNAFFRMPGKKGKAALSLRYQLHPVQPEDFRKPEIIGGTGCAIFSKEWAKQGLDEVALYTQAWCLPDYVETMKPYLVNECSKVLRDRAAFMLNCIDALEVMG
ncbi:hypothetical protein KZ843_26330 [Pseudomonas aeruginosa]|nr:hypothetical protein [Pseudomonas aeruginosa]MBW6126393.1 hypothetical protein [Pseudomonas aeruginosa]